MSTASPQRDDRPGASTNEAAGDDEDTTWLEGVTSEQVRHATEEDRAEGEPDNDDAE
ncbi:hypothetical protein [Kitasatospora sp. LaBMicrA B282]|uniref:hypothetical protein n=1 Tax=Kitasatospora sp. LaBMicrA B282 TaxID=3420949 RepID=UPI003D112B92